MELSLPYLSSSDSSSSDQEDSGYDQSASSPDVREYQVFRVDYPSTHDLYTIQLKGRGAKKGDPPLFFTQLQEGFNQYITAEHDYETEFTNLRFQFHNELRRETFSWSNYKESLTVKLALWAADLIRQLDSMTRDSCYIARRNQDHEYAFHISGCEQHLSMGDHLIATNDADKKIFIGNVMRVSLTEVVAKMPKEFVLALDGKKSKISFGIRWTPFLIQENCLHYAANELGPHVLFPDKAILRKPLVQVKDPKKWEWHNPLMNEFQKEAVLNVLRGEYRPIPYLVSGPPGTGKTSTLIEYVHQVYKHLPSAKILICTPSNTAANVVMKMLIQSKWIDVQKEAIRMVSYSHILSGDIPGNLRKYCGTLPMENSPKEMKSIFELSDLTDHRIVITTVNYSGNFMRMGLFKHFTHLIVDEAGQALETETLIPFALMNKSTAHLALFGDEKQLGPVVLYSVLRKLHFDVSMFERLSFRQVYYDNAPLYSRLLNNYRSVPNLLKFYNELFYQERLIAMVTDSNSAEFQLLNRLDHLFPPSYNRMRYRGLYFFRVETPCFKEPRTMSWYNPGEIVKLLEFYKKLLANNVKAADIGIVTPYRAQHREIMEALGKMKLTAPKVGTVEVFQGDQRMVMLMSPVRSYPEGSRSTNNISLGFVNNPKRINVAISRGRALLVIFGNNTVLSGSDHWNRLIKIADSDSTLILH